MLPRNYPNHNSDPAATFTVLLMQTLRNDAQVIMLKIPANIVHDEYNFIYIQQKLCISMKYKSISLKYLYIGRQRIIIYIDAVDFVIHMYQEVKFEERKLQHISVTQLQREMCDDAMISVHLMTKIDSVELCGSVGNKQTFGASLY